MRWWMASSGEAWGKPQIKEHLRRLLELRRMHLEVPEGVLHLVKGPLAHVHGLGPGLDGHEVADELLGGVGLMVGGVEVVLLPPHLDEEPSL